ncbi:hypothetical protein DPMN_090181 [Dreissena polymorpha]|uniref:HAT C-terminal dimerisation domain-containing protein n=1 Tax=Dreissena polymorpha TaxID=45954 RepID=A0A9D4QYU3_DREPO|nr:hypothetical protein DPMN_090181 [Dreissena polymorpha]
MPVQGYDGASNMSGKPVSTATADRSFCSITRVKTYLRSTMGMERMSGLALLNIHR